MRVRNAETILDKTDFNNQVDWETYPTADYTCDNCNDTIAISFKSLTKHAYNNFSNLSDIDKGNIEKIITATVDHLPSSYLDFYCPTCNRPVRIYYESWAGGRHTEAGHSLKYVVD
jgi:uncharacterized protein YlaI